MKNILPLVSVFLISGALFGQEIFPNDQEALITFKITDYKEIPEEGAVITATGIDTVLEKTGTSDVEGIYKMLLPEGKKYKLSVHKFDEDFDFEKPLSLPKVDGAIRFEQKLKIRIITEYLRVYTLDHVYFDFNKSDIKKESFPAIDGLLNALKGNQKMKVEIAGHTDNIGDSKTNMVLSQKRADAVMIYLTGNGISQNRILAKGYGASAPVASNDDEAGRQKNRRTEVKVIVE